MLRPDDETAGPFGAQLGAHIARRFFSERAASKISDVAEGTKPRPIKAVAVIGAGTMGGGIAMSFLNAGIPVTLLEVQQDALDRGVATMRKNFVDALKRAQAANKPFPEVHIRGDKNVRFEAIGRVILACQQAGIQKVGFITEPHALEANSY